MKLNWLYSVADEGARFVCAVKAAYDVGWRGAQKGADETRYLFTNMALRMSAGAYIGYSIAEDFGCMVGMALGAVEFGLEWVAGVYWHDYKHPPTRPVREPVKLETIVRRVKWINEKVELVELANGRTERVDWE